MLDLIHEYLVFKTFTSSITVTDRTLAVQVMELRIAEQLEVVLLKYPRRHSSLLDGFGVAKYEGTLMS